MRAQNFKTPITELFGIRHPLICGGLMWLADANYVASVVNAGGMGFITCLSFPDDPKGFRDEVRMCRELTDGKPFGVSISISRRLGKNERLLPYLDIVEEEGVEFIESSGDSPDLFIPRLRAAGCKLIHKVPAVRYAVSAQKLDVDAITVIGGEAGGHPGLFMTGSIIQAVLAARSITKPLVVGGGMGTGEHLAAVLAMGADAMLMGTRMVVAEEIWANQIYKQLVTKTNEMGTQLVLKALKLNKRVLDNDSARAVLELEAAGASDFPDFQAHIMGELVKSAYQSGDYSKGLIDLGPAAVFADAIEPVEAIFDGIIDGALTAQERLNCATVAGRA